MDDQPRADFGKDITKEELINEIIRLRESLERSRDAANEAEDLYASHLAAIVESSDDAIIGKTLEGTITSWNQGAEKIYGYSSNEAIGRPISFIVPPGHPDEIPSILEAIKRGERVDHYITTRIRKDGTIISISLTVSPIYDGRGNIIGASAIGRDITDRIRLTKELEESREKYRRIVETAEEGIVVVDNDAIIRFVNPKICEMLGYSESELTGTSLLKYVDEDGHECIEAVLMKHREGKKIQFQFPFRKKDRSHVWAIVPTAPITDAAGHMEGSLFMISEISSLKKTEAELKLAKEHADMYLDLMSHDINNINQASSGYLELLLNSYISNPIPDSDRIKLISNAMTLLGRTTTLIDNVRKIQLVTKGEIRIKNIDLCKVLRELSDSFSRMPGRSVHIDLSPSPECMVAADELVSDIFYNLIDNAIKHSPAGNRVPVDIHSSVVIEGGVKYLKVSVDDHGPGIPDYVKGLLFQKFQRGDTSARGMGLGLYLVKSLIHSYGGKVWVEDRVPGDYRKGSSFVVMLRVA